MKINKNQTHCTNCGAPTTSEICPYCNATTGIETKYSNMEYPVIECKESKIGFWNVIFPGIFAFGFGSSSFIPLSMAFLIDEQSLFMFFFTIPFALIGIIATILTIIPIIRYIQVKTNGKEIDATVYGYMDDIMYINNLPAQIVKLLVTTNEGPRFILYQLNDNKQLYKINSKIKLKVYKDMFYIQNKKQYYFE